MSGVPILEAQHFETLFPTLKVENRLTHGIEETWAAWDNELNKPLTIKVFRLEDPREWKNIKPFKREIEAFVKTSHPALPAVQRYRESKVDGLDFYLVMEGVEGESLEYWQPRSEEDLKAIATELSEILKDLHDFQPPLLHRNLRPSNIIQTTDGLKLVNFGFVYLLNPKEANAQRVWSEVREAGYPHSDRFSNPVQADIYGLGATMVYLACGEKLSDVLGINGKIEWEENSKVELSPDFRAWIERCLNRSDKSFSSPFQAQVALMKSWDSGINMAAVSRFLEVETRPDGLIVRTNGSMLKWLWSTRTKFTISGELLLLLFIGLIALGIALIEIGLGVGIAFTSFTFLTFFYVVRRVSGRLELNIDTSSWTLTLNGEEVRRGCLEELNGVRAETAIGHHDIPRLVLELVDGEKFETSIEVAEPEVAKLNRLVRRFKSSVR